MVARILLAVSTVYPYFWPVAFITMGFIALFEPHLHFTVFGKNISGHTLMWFMMGLAHADIFWRGWRQRRKKAAS